MLKYDANMMLDNEDVIMMPSWFKLDVHLHDDMLHDHDHLSYEAT